MKSISIKNYKNLRDLKIDSLSKVNLIVGMNNSGKSTLLEAISIFATGGDLNQIRWVLKNRGLEVADCMLNNTTVDDEKELYQSLYSNYDIKSFLYNPVTISADNNLVSIQLAKVVERWVAQQNGEKILRNVVLQPNEDTLVGDTVHDGLSVSRGGSSTYTYIFKNQCNNISFKSENFLPFEYVQTSNILNNDNPRLFDKIALSNLENELLNALNIIEPRIDAINFLRDEKQAYISDRRVPIVVYKGSTQRYRLSTMGDGINRILTIILSMLNCKGGVLLIDEFDNGLHHSVQTKLWTMIYRLAESLDVQVFATTHSDDCIKSFTQADEKGDGKLIRLEDRSGDIVAVEFNDKERLMFAINNKVEVR